MKQIVFTKPNRAELVDAPETGANAPPVRNEVSLVSIGTEMAIYSGGESWAKLPFVPGYASVGTICGANENEFASGTRVFTHGRHQEYTTEKVLTVAVPDDVPSRHAVFARMASVSMTAIRVGHIELGDWVAVYGAGLVGNLAAQLARLAGAHVVLVDRSADRLAVAQKCGIADCVLADGSELEAIDEVTGGQRCSTVIEATGVTAVAEYAMDAVAPCGELILLGTPRAEHSANFADFLRKIHLASSLVTVKGAHEWCYPTLPAKGRDAKHSILRNTHIILELIRTKQLSIEDLISDVFTPEAAPEIYPALAADPDRYLGVLIDWSGRED